MKNLLSILILLLGMMTVSQGQNENAANASLHARYFTLGNHTLDTLYAHDLKVKIPSNTTFASCRLTIESVGQNTTIKDTTYVLPAADISNESTYSISRTGNHLIIHLDSFSLLTRHHLKLYFIKSDGAEISGADFEF